MSYGAFRSMRDPNEFYIHTRWKNMAAFERHAELPHTVRFVESVESLGRVALAKTGMHLHKGKTHGDSDR